MLTALGPRCDKWDDKLWIESNREWPITVITRFDALQ